MRMSQKFALLATIACFTGFGFYSAEATDIDLSATMTASAAVTVANASNIDFGGIDFTAAHSGTVELGPDGNAALGGGSTNLALTGTPAAGQLDVTSSSGTIEVTCDAAAVIGDGTQDLAVTTIVWDTSAATYAGATNTCGGLGVGAVAIDTGVSNDPSIFVGAELTVGGNELAASSGSTPFDTATGGGDPITFRFVFQ